MDQMNRIRNVVKLLGELGNEMTVPQRQTVGVPHYAAAQAVRAPSVLAEQSQSENMKPQVLVPEKMDPECMAAQIPLGESGTPREPGSSPEGTQTAPPMEVHTAAPAANTRSTLMNAIIMSEILSRPVSLRGRYGHTSQGRGGWR